MEPDGITRVYLTSGGPPNAWLRFPEETDHTSRLLGEEAQEVLARCDFRCVSIVSMPPQPWDTSHVKKSIYSCYEGTDYDNSFEINRLAWADPDGEAELAAELEKRAGKKGLTIVAS